MMNEIHKAYSILGLEPGAPFEAVKRRYRKLVLVWHPDRMRNADAKREVEEELKKINSMFEKLKKHFDTEHKTESGCRCQAAAAGPPPGGNRNSGSGGGKSYHSGPSSETDRKRRDEESKRQTAERERKQREEEETRRRTAERKRKQAEEDAAQRAAEAARRAEEKLRAAEEAVNSEAARKEEMLRWKCSLAVGAAFVILIGYCWLGCTVRDAGRAIGKHWEEFQQQFKPKPVPQKPITPYYKREAPSRLPYPSPFAPPAPPPW